jgi:hypothetical protein
MVTKNRKKQSSKPMVPAQFAVVVVIAASVSLGYLWLGSRCETLGKEIKTLESTNDDLHRKCLYEESRWANMMAPREMEKALRHHNISGAWPREAQIVRLSMSDDLDALANGTQTEFAQYAQIRRSPAHE